MIPQIPHERCSKCEIYSKCVSKLDRLLSGWIQELNDQLESSATPADLEGDAPSADFRDDPVDLVGKPRCQLIEGEISGDCLRELGESDAGLGDNSETVIPRNPVTSEKSIIDGDAEVGDRIISNSEFGETGNCRSEGGGGGNGLELGCLNGDQSSKYIDNDGLVNCDTSSGDGRFLTSDCRWSGMGGFVAREVKEEVGAADIENDRSITKPADDHDAPSASASPGSPSDGYQADKMMAIKSELSDGDCGSVDASTESTNSGESVLNLINHVDGEDNVDHGRLWDGEDNSGKVMDGLLVPGKDSERCGVFVADRSDRFYDFETLGSENSSIVRGKSCVDLVPMVEEIFKTNVLPAEDVIPASLDSMNKGVPIGDCCKGKDDQNRASSFLDRVSGPIADSVSTSGGIGDGKNHFMGSNSLDLANCCGITRKPNRKRHHTDFNLLGCGGDVGLKRRVPMYDGRNGGCKRRSLTATVVDRNSPHGPPDTLIGGSSLDCCFPNNITADRALLSALGDDGAMCVPQTLSNNIVASKPNAETLVDHHGLGEAEPRVEQQLMLTNTNDADIAKDGFFSMDLSDDPLHLLAISSEAPYDIPSIEQYLEFIGGKTYRCRICSRLFSNKRRYPSYRHVRLHLKTGQFPCRFCGKRFARKDYVIRHMRTVHASY